MNENPSQLDISTELARERSREAADRTLMAWVRTSLSLIGFGFGIGKILHYLNVADPRHAEDPTQSARLFGGAFIALGVLGLLCAIFQHWETLRRIRRKQFVYAPLLPVTEVVALILLFIGLYGFVLLFA
jgi:putative membrane protein